MLIRFKIKTSRPNSNALRLVLVYLNEDILLSLFFLLFNSLKMSKRIAYDMSH